MKFCKKLREAIPEKTKVKIKMLFSPVDNPKWMRYADTEKKVIYVFLAGFYQNLGDMALTYSQKRFLQQLYPDAEVVTVPSTGTYEAVKTIKRIIRPGDIVTTIAGGNMDDMYISLEEARLYVVKSFPNNKVISFPQTFAFSDTPFGRKRQEISHKVYSKHKDLTIFVREPYSLERIQKAFPDVKTGYCPDIVLSLDKTEPRCERNGVLCCLRSDKEENMQSGQREKLIKATHARFDDVTIKDTVDVSLEECTEDRYEQALESFWDMLRHKEVVITDRLHCMIFCVITGTPCVVMDNSNHKISGVYNAWLKDANYIRFVEKNEVETVIRVAEEVRTVEVRQPMDLSDQFESLRKACKV